MQNGLAAEQGDLGSSGLQHGASAHRATAQAKAALARPRGAGGLTLVAVTGGSSHLTPELVEKRAFRQSDGRGRERGEGLVRGSLAGAKRAGSLRGVVVTMAAINW